MENIINFEEAFKAADQVHGWFAKKSAFVFYLINKIQTQEKIQGDIFEIGCHLGKTAVFLSHFLNEKERLVVCDVFNNQKQNTSNSGYSPHLSVSLFLRNLTKYGKKNYNLRILNCNSLKLNSKKITRKFRMIHVDGGHSLKETKSDLKLSFDCLLDNGVVVLDDVFNRDWPDVAEGLKIFFQNNTDVCPFFIDYKKVFLCNKKYVDFYQNKIKNNYEKTLLNIDISYDCFLNFRVGKI
jgi:hypothetical protein